MQPGNLCKNVELFVDLAARHSSSLQGLPWRPKNTRGLAGLDIFAVVEQAVDSMAESPQSTSAYTYAVPVSPFAELQ